MMIDLELVGMISTRTCSTARTTVCSILLPKTSLGAKKVRNKQEVAVEVLLLPV